MVSTIGPVVAGVLVALQIVAVLRRVEAWPFSAYEMYSHDWRMSTVATYRVRLVAVKGTEVWWQPQLDKDRQAFSIQFAGLLHTSTDAEQFGLRARELIERLVIPDLYGAGRPTNRFRRIQVLERRVTSGHAGLSIDERLAYSVLVTGPKSDVV
ncbi:hypothetical protein AB5J72_39555 [Streptomyces sp. CG1]|uniref:hypothetical protein n=1 Tax=Streptomyces sp. CG1 TaxID=1287523 RepID=UPI0034E286A8